MGILYLAAMTLGLGTIVAQLSLSGDGGHADAHAGSESDTHLAHDGVVPFLLSLRFWAFGLAGFGMSGSMLHYLRLSSGWVTLLVAVAMGIASGSFATWVLRALMRADTTSGGATRNTVGRMAKVLVPCERGGRGKIRIEVAGQSHDFLMTTDEERLRAGELVLVEDARDSLLTVSRPPVELLPPKSDE